MNTFRTYYVLSPYIYCGRNYKDETTSRAQLSVVFGIPPRRLWPGLRPYICNTEKKRRSKRMSQTDPVEQAQRHQEELQVMGEQLLSKVKELIHEGNVRRIIIKQEGHTIMEIPLTVGLVSVIVAPVLAAIGAIGALIAPCSIEVI